MPTTNLGTTSVHAGIGTTALGSRPAPVVFACGGFTGYWESIQTSIVQRPYA